jgi:hypothetical protein
MKVLGTAAHRGDVVMVRRFRRRCLTAVAASGELRWSARDPGAREKGGNGEAQLNFKGGAQRGGAHRRDGVAAAPR